MEKLEINDKMKLFYDNVNEWNNEDYFDYIAYRNNIIRLESLVQKLSGQFSNESGFNVKNNTTPQIYVFMMWVCDYLKYYNLPQPSISIDTKKSSNTAVDEINIVLPSTKDLSKDKIVRMNDDDLDKFDILTINCIHEYGSDDITYEINSCNAAHPEALLKNTRLYTAYNMWTARYLTVIAITKILNTYLFDLIKDEALKR